MTKDEAFQKIKELEEFISGYGKATRENVFPGAIFKYNSGDFITIIKHNYPKTSYYVSGVKNNPFEVYSVPPRSLNEMVEYLNEFGYVYYGKNSVTMIKEI